MLGQTPIWPAAPALDVERRRAAAVRYAGGSASVSAPAAAPAAASSATAAANVAAAQVPVAALAAALEQTVSGSGLFYESHLAQWLAGQRSPDSLADEAQNKLVAEAAQLPLDWTSDDGDASAPNRRRPAGHGRSGQRRANGAPNGASDANAQHAPPAPISRS